jgi:glycosyltransferase involved in cell wall biosynthesis
VSVVVPTHERAHYAVSTIRSLLDLSDEIEVVVSDSSENDAISPAFSGVQASARLKILRPTKKLSVVDNFNFMTLCDKTINKMGPNKARTTAHHDCP